MIFVKAEDVESLAKAMRAREVDPAKFDDAEGGYIVPEWFVLDLRWGLGKREWSRSTVPAEFAERWKRWSKKRKRRLAARRRRRRGW